VIVETLGSLNMHYPKVADDVGRIPIE
jgi:hypothetical protein